MQGERLHIAVGVIYDRVRDRVLIARRPDNVHMGGLWEFPGGKCREGEEVQHALARELFEELSLVVDHCRPLITIDYDYVEKWVKLDVWTVLDWHGDVHGKEGQLIEWVAPAELLQRKFPDANNQILEIVKTFPV